MSKGKKKGNKPNSELTQKIISTLREATDQPLNYKQIASKLKISDTRTRNVLIKSLHSLVLTKKIKEVERGKYKLIQEVKYIEGRLDISAKGNGYVISDSFETDVFIKSKFLGKALHGDIVKVYVFNRRENGKIEGEITQVVHREKTTYVGIVQLSKKFAFVIPYDEKMHVDIFVSLSDLNGAQDGDKVLVELIEWEGKSEAPTGKVSQVLGRPGEHNTEIHSILASFNLPHEFPKEVSQYADQLNTAITSKDVAARRDMRDTLTFTIDPRDAKDFDDAISFKNIDKDKFEVGIHIADVSHYLEVGSILDKEAYERATSVYLVDRVVPMLPEVLSNEACSLRPNEDKLTFSVVFLMDHQGKIYDQWIGRTVTHSDARFSYEEAQIVIETEKRTIPADISLSSKAYEIGSELFDSLVTLNVVAKILRKNRMKNGAISFDKVEVKFDLNEACDPVGVFFKTSQDANKLIEEFMLLANRSVASFIGLQKPIKPFVYRIHDEPDEQKLYDLKKLISNFGYELDVKNRKTIASSLNQLLNDIKGKKEQNLIDTLTIRTMSKAEYSTQNVGHYGLAFDYYSHFTSPIRRYPDVMVHRLLQHYLDKGALPNAQSLEEQCKHCSEMENVATKAERESIKYMQIKYMQNHDNRIFNGVISGVTEWGVYVEIIENKCEGMVRMRDMKQDHFIFDQTTYSAVGQRTGISYQLGDEVSVRVKNCDLVKKHLDFYLVDAV